MIQWNDTFVTNHPRIDYEHRQLVAGLNELELALEKELPSEQIAKTLDVLSCYTRAHFTHEEDLMRRTACPALEQNCREHAAFEASLDAWIIRLRHDPSLPLVRELHREATAWIHRHIVHTDCKLRQCSAG